MQSTVVSESFVRNLLRDTSFFSVFPEFNSLKPVISAAKKPRTGGCHRCGKGRKPEERLLSGFITIMRSLASERITALKQRAGAQQLQFHGYNHIRGAHEVMIL